MNAKNKTNIVSKRVIDAVLTALLLFLMAYQVTGDVLHEWLGIAMTALLVVHHILNRKWYSALFKGKYKPYRIVMTSVNTMLLVSITLTALTGMAMSGHAVPFLYGFIGVMRARSLHLAMSYWSFILMGVHIGMHFGIITAKLPKGKIRIIAGCILSVIAAYGFRLFLDADVFDYMFFKSHFAFFDYNKAWWIVLLENALMLLSWAFMAYLLLLVLRSVSAKEKKNRKKIVMTVMFAAGIALIAGAGTALHFLIPAGF